MIVSHCAFTKEGLQNMLFNREIRQIELFGSLVPEPRILIDFLGFEKHVVQIRGRRGVSISPLWYDHAAYFSIDLPPEKLYGNGCTVEVPNFVKALDYELEIGCLVTKKAMLKSLPQAVEFFKENCLLTILNDWSARDIQKKDMEGLGPANSKFIIGKSIGPKFVKASQFKIDENGVFDMPVKLSVNGKLRTDSNYNTIYHTHPSTKTKSAWSFPKLLTFLGNLNIAVEPGYLLGSGTVGDGCIAEFSAKIDPSTGKEIEPAKYPWLQDGDKVVIEVDHIGELANTVKFVESPNYAKSLAGVAACK